MEEPIQYSGNVRGALPWKCLVDARVADKDGNKKECYYNSEYFGSYTVTKNGETVLVSLVLSMKGRLIEVVPSSVVLSEPVRFAMSKKDGTVIELSQ